MAVDLIPSRAARHGRRIHAEAWSARASRRLLSSTGWLAYAASAVLVLAAVASLAYGFVAGRPGATYLSIALSVVASVVVLRGVLRDEPPPR